MGGQQLALATPAPMNQIVPAPMNEPPVAMPEMPNEEQSPAATEGEDAPSP